MAHKLSFNGKPINYHLILLATTVSNTGLETYPTGDLTTPVIHVAISQFVGTLTTHHLACVAGIQRWGERGFRAWEKCEGCARGEGPPCAPLAFLLCQHLPCRLPDTSCGPCIIQNVFIFQMYLRSWAKELSVPILSIDYSLAPEAPFPRALEECFFVYAWCLNNFHHLGTNGKRVCVAGDSAGRTICSRVYHYRVHRVTCMFPFQSTGLCKSHLVSFNFFKGQ